MAAEGGFVNFTTVRFNHPLLTTMLIRGRGCRMDSGGMENMTMDKWFHPPRPRNWLGDARSTTVPRWCRDAVPGIEINFGTRDGLDRSIRNEIEKQAVRIF
jgi:hypothetical protein